MFRLGQYLRWPAYTLRTPRHFFSPALRAAILAGGGVPRWYRLSTVMDPADELRYATTGAFIAFMTLQWDLGGFDGLKWFVPAVAWIVGVAVAGRHASYLLGQPDLAERMRQGFQPPYLSFVKIAVVDYVATVLVLFWLDGGRFSRLDETQLAGTATALLQPADAFSAVTDVRSVQLSVAGVGAFVLAVLFSASTVAGLLRVKAFRRTDEDRIALAVHALARGEPSIADKQLKEIHNPSAAAVTARAVTAAAQGQPQEAWRWMNIEADIGGVSRTDLHTAAILGPHVGNALMTFDAVYTYLADLRGRGLPEMAGATFLSEAWMMALLRDDEVRTWWFESGLDRLYPILTAAYVMLPIDGPRPAADLVGDLAPVDPSDVALLMLTRLKIRRVAEFRGDEEARDLCPMQESEWDRLRATTSQLEVVAVGSVLATAHAVLQMFDSGATKEQLLDLISELERRIQKDSSLEGVDPDDALRRFNEQMRVFPEVKWPRSDRPASDQPAP